MLLYAEGSVIKCNVDFLVSCQYVLNCARNLFITNLPIMKFYDTEFKDKKEMI